MTNKDINRKPHSRRAFSLYEVAVVIIIIGIFVSGIIAADKMVSKFRLAAAKTLATSSPINSIKETALWLETSLDNGFNPSEEEDGATVSLWKDQQNSGNPKASVVAVDGGPTYANTINRVHAVEFGKSGSAGYLQFNASFLNKTDYTIIILEKRKTAGANYFLKSIDGSNADDDKLNLGYLDDKPLCTHREGFLTIAIRRLADTAIQKTSLAFLLLHKVRSKEAKLTSTVVWLQKMQLRQHNCLG